MVVVDGAVWKNKFDMVWKPVFSPDGGQVAVKIESNGRYGIAVNDRLWDQACDAVWEPVFSPQGDKILLRTLQDNLYLRQVISVNEILR
jgi:hypothetical protein